jgi:iron complex transport system permease protein
VKRGDLLGLILLIAVFAASLAWGGAAEWDPEIIRTLRLPRTLLALGVGGALSLSGLLLQTAFANPLCEPFTLGVSSGAALGAILGSLLMPQSLQGGVALCALGGALGFALSLSLLSTRRTLGRTGLLLAGVMLSFLGSSLVSVVMALSDPNGIYGAIIWLLGDLSRATWASVALVGFGLALGAGATRFMGRDLDALLLGDESARGQGVDVRKLRNRALLIASFLAGVAVSSAGMIGFVGLMVPHYCRARFGALHRGLVGRVILWGAVALVFADILARKVADPLELPVGPIAAFIGIPLFFFAFVRGRHVRD